MKLELTPLELTLRKPLESSTGVLSHRVGFIVTLRTPEAVGHGEAMPMESFGTESLELTAAALKRFELPAIPRSLEAISRLTAPLIETPAARFAVECALLEHLAITKGVSVAALLGATRTDVPVNALLEGDDATALAADAVAAVERGFTVLKVKMGARPLSVEAQRLFAVRRAVGPHVKLRIDANGGWSEATARSALRGLESLELELCEQPVAAHDVEALRRLRRQVPCRIAADEAALRRAAIPRMLERDPDAAADVIVIKPMALGGLLLALELARTARAEGVTSYVTTLLDGPLARAAAAHLAAAMPDDGWAHGLATAELFEGVVPDAFTPQRGRITIPAAPGWGLG